MFTDQTEARIDQSGPGARSGPVLTTTHSYREWRETIIRLLKRIGGNTHATDHPPTCVS